MGIRYNSSNKDEETKLFEIKEVLSRSAAESCGIQKGDKIISINNQELIDYIDYVYFSALSRLDIKLERDSETVKIKLNKSEDEDLGLEFTQPLMGRKRACSNKCIFCFVEQLPKGMRKSLYFKDEDWRYSLIMGNYVTMAAIDKSEINRIIKRKASPLYISVHTVDEALRRYMLGNDSAVKIRPLLNRFKRNGIRFHAQVVVCPGVNDGEKLEQSIKFLSRLYPSCMSLAVVPVGLTGFRDGLTDIAPVNEKTAKETILMVESWQKECLNRMGTRFVYAADEYYIKAKLQIPEYESYEAFEQIENGVGMLAKFKQELYEEGELFAKRPISIATGTDAFEFFKGITESISGSKADVYKVENGTFGQSVTVSGLLAGKDYLKALEGKPLGEKLLITADSLREDNIFLDDMTLDELSNKLGVEIVPIKDGYHFASVVRGAGEE